MMLSIREQVEAMEARSLGPKACLSRNSKGRRFEEAPDEMRPCFQRDRDRVVHSKAFRRLAGKTQVFLAPIGDHYRTRMTHSIEVSQVGCAIARALHLNTMLVEAISLGHDLGHTPFGHAGERTLRKLIPGGFHHARQTLRIVTETGRSGRGLNLSEEVLDGIAKHSKGKGRLITDNPATLSMTLEGQVMRLSDIIAYVNHDFDDACRAGLLQKEDLPEQVGSTLGWSHSDRLSTLVADVVRSSEDCGLDRIYMTPEVVGALEAFRDFLYDRVYLTQAVTEDFDRAAGILNFLWDYCMADEDRFRAEFDSGVLDGPHHQRVADYITGMTDRFAIRLYERLFMPRAWSVF
ncbi:MAG: deoxyguanosinetriphosphate triphosphohydrolase [Myxococcota bacterium]|nr:deoxyguanosinetriphosphate triphosphohydrolase [Myxococcota bacterium]